MSDNPANIKKMYLVIFGALFVWASYLAIGSYLSIGPSQTIEELTNTANAQETLDITDSMGKFDDLRKPALVLGTMLVFLGFWGVALLVRKKRLAREAEQKRLDELEE
ncbi:MAG: hypothetical protein COA78_13365 [Blastopirellula sp.]|nr:MAG: hypothetical protein COA78_13365 [Blastopirellula sp.]